MNYLCTPNLSRRVADHCGVGFDGVNHHGVRSNHRIIADCNRPKDHAANPKNDVVPDIGTQPWIKLHVELFGTHIHSLEEGYIAADPSRSDHAPRRVGEQEAGTDFAPGCDFQTEQHQVQIGQKIGKNRNSREHCGPAGTVQNARKKAMMKHPAEEAKKVRPHVRSAFQLELAGEITVEKLL